MQTNTNINEIMKFHKLFLLAALSCSLTSCFKDEPANAECDIEAAWIHTENPEDMFYNLSDTIVNVLYTDNLITFNVKSQTNLTELAPMFKITPRATITPASGSVQDFSRGPVIYTVTSEDGDWQREYYVYFNVPTSPGGDTPETPGGDPGHDEGITIKYSFEDYSLNSDGKYYTWISTTKWDTGNPGFAVTGMANYTDEKGQYLNDPERYPSIPLKGNGYKGNGVKLETKDTGPFGAMAKMRIAAGNLFIGSFDLQYALTDARKATNFGQPFTRMPKKLKGFYKYKPGETYQDENGKAVPGKTDAADIYAVMYYNHDAANNVVMLNGNDVKTSPYIVAIAQVTGLTTTDEWTAFEADFSFKEEIDQTLLNNRGYNLAIVFSSSVDGAYFEGAIGSTLMIDEVELICTDTQQ